MKMIIPKTGSIDYFSGFIPKRNDLPYYRKENNNYSSMLTNNGDSDYSMLNGTGNLILSLCTGSNSVHDILVHLQNEYPDVSEKTLFDDLVKVLHLLTQTNAINWRNKDMANKNPFSFSAVGQLSENCTISLAMEHEIRELVAFNRDAITHIADKQENILNYVWGTNYREYDSGTIIRQCLYSYYKDFFLIKSSGHIIGSIIVRPALEVFLNKATIQMLTIPKHLIEPALKNIVSFYSTFPFKRINLLEILIPEDFYDEHPFFIEHLKAVGFSLESVQNKVYLNKSLYSYSIPLLNQCA